MYGTAMSVWLANFTERRFFIMFKKQLLRLVPHALRYILLSASCNWITLLANIIFIYTVSQTFLQLLSGALPDLLRLGVVLLACLIVRSIAQYQAVQCAAACTLQVKQSLRHAIYEKLLRTGTAWKQRFSHAEIVQMATEGVEQLELYFGQFLPQVLYSILATVTLFVVIAPRSIATAVVLFVCIPLIPIAMMAVQKIARKMLNQYWGTYTDLGDVFLDGLEGLTTLKIYQADARYHTKINAMAEQFRIITMKAHHATQLHYCYGFYRIWRQCLRYWHEPVAIQHRCAVSVGSVNHHFIGGRFLYSASIIGFIVSCHDEWHCSSG